MSEDLKPSPAALERMARAWCIEHYDGGPPTHGDPVEPFRQALAALAQHDQATPGVEPVAWAVSWKADGRSVTRSYDQRHAAEWQVNFLSTRPTASEIQGPFALYALPTPIRGGREEIARESLRRLKGLADEITPEMKSITINETEQFVSDLRSVLALPASIGVGKEGGKDV